MNGFEPGEGFYDAIADRISKRAQWAGECLVMPGYQSHNGHVRISVLGKTMSASRAAWMLYHRQPVPEDMVVRHSCDNPPCVARDHLLLGTQDDNMRDMVVRQRFRVTYHNERCRKGHARTDANTRTRDDGRRECLQCEQERAAQRSPRPYSRTADARRRAVQNLLKGHEYVGRI